MIRISSFSDLINSYPIMDHAIRFNQIGHEWQQLFDDYPELTEVFRSIQHQDGYAVSRGDVFAETDVRRKIIKTLIWGFPNGYRGMHNLAKIMANMDGITETLSNRRPAYTEYQVCELFRNLKSFPGLGFSTVTKLLYFFNIECGHNHAVIVDSNVLKAIPNIREMNGCPCDWAPESYCKQVNYINRIANRLGIVQPDKIEYFLFNFGKAII